MIILGKEMNNLKDIVSKVALGAIIALNAYKSKAQSDTVRLSIDPAQKPELVKFLNQRSELDFIQLTPSGAFSIKKDAFSLALIKNKNDTFTIKIKPNDEISNVTFVMVTANTYRFYISIDGILNEIHVSADFTISVGPESCPENKKLLLNWSYITTDGKKHFSHGHCSHYSSSPSLRK
jgi:hypothetical protein